MTQHMHEPDPDPSEEGADEALPLIELETLLTRHSSGRKQLAQLGLVLLAAVVVAVLWASTVPRAPQPTTPPPGLLITSNVSAGTVTINGQKQSGQLPMVAALYGDWEDIRLDAPPFLPKSCQVQVSHPDSSDEDTCQGVSLSPAHPVLLHGVSVAVVFALDIFLTLEDLPPEHQHQVTDVLRQTVSSQHDLLVPAGSYFATSVDASGEIASQRAPVSLRASASITPFTPPGHEGFFPCAAWLCAGSVTRQTPAPSAGMRWDIWVSVALHWRFRTTAGMGSSEVQFQPAQRVHLAVSFTRAEGWTISSDPSPEGPLPDQVARTFCATGQVLLRRVAAVPASMTIDALSDRGAEGCELVLKEQSSERGHFLWRFGVVLAADAQAHATHPELPVAPPADIAAVEQP